MSAKGTQHYNLKNWKRVRASQQLKCAFCPALVDKERFSLLFLTVDLIDNNGFHWPW